MIESKYKQVKKLHKQVVKTSGYALYADFVLNICHPEFLRIKFLVRFLKFYGLNREDIGIPDDHEGKE